MNKKLKEYSACTFPVASLSKDTAESFFLDGILASATRLYAHRLNLSSGVTSSCPRKIVVAATGVRWQSCIKSLGEFTVKNFPFSLRQSSIVVSTTRAHLDI